MENGHHGDGLQVALLTVHVEAAALEQMRSIASHMPWRPVARGLRELFLQHETSGAYAASH